MPIGTQKNRLYQLALPILGKRCEWNTVLGGNPQTGRKLRTILKRNHAVGACVQCFHRGGLCEVYTAGNAVMEPEKLLVTKNTFFRTASIAKMVSALLVFRLQTLGKLSIFEPVSDFLGYPVQNPFYPDAPITLGMLLGHTSGIIDSPAYFNSFDKPCDLSVLLKDAAAYQPTIPGVSFRYSNLAAGLVGCLLEARFGVSFETLAQRELFLPLNVKATYDLTAAKNERIADSYRVLPPMRSFDAQSRMLTASPVTTADPERHYLLASGNLYLTAEGLSRLALLAWRGKNGFLNDQSLAQLQKPVTQWPEKTIHMRHGMGLLQVNDPKVCAQPIWGHQGFAYGAVNGVFFDQSGNGFALLNSGASERRFGHLAQINQELIELFLK